MERSGDPHCLQSRLAADIMYFYMAADALKRARSSLAAIEDVERQWKAAIQREAQLTRHYENTESASAELDRIYERTSIQLVDNLHPMLEEAYAPQIAGLVEVHILSAAALEAHINIAAEAALTKSQFEAFDRLSLEGKWMFLPPLLGRSAKPLEPGTEPLQSVKRLVKLRNDLMHHKPVRQEWRLGKVPDFVDELGLTLDQGVQSLEGVRVAVVRLAELRSRPTPRWLAQRPCAWLTSDAHEDLIDSLRPKNS